MHLRPGGGQRLGGGARASQPEDLVTRADQLANDRRADPAGRSGDEYTYGKTSK
jgi:hypothetical protein